MGDSDASVCDWTSLVCGSNETVVWTCVVMGCTVSVDDEICD